MDSIHFLLRKKHSPRTAIKRSLFIQFLLMSVAYAGSLPRESWHNYYDYLLGNYQLACAKPQASFEHYQQVLKTASSPYPYEGFLQLLSATGNFPTIVSLIPKLDKPFEDNLQVQLIFVQALYETGKEQEADQRAMKLQAKYKKSAELTFMAAQAHSKSSPVRGLEVIDEFLNHAPFQQRHCLFYYLKSQIYGQLNNRDKAVEFAKKSVELCPHLQKKSVLYGLLNANKEQVAQPTVVPVHKPTARRVELHLMDGCINDGLFLFNKKQYDAALTHVDHCLLQDPKHEYGRLLKIQVLTAQGKPDRAAKLLTQWIHEDPNNQAYFQALYWLTFTGISQKQLLDMLLTLAEKYPQNLQVQLYLADLYTKADDLTTALACHGKARLACDCPKMKTKILYHEGLLNFELGKYALAEQLFSQAAGLQQPLAHLDNIRAYLYATKAHDLPKAEALITQALATDPHNPYFLDTQAVVWYREGHHEKAAAQLEKLVQNYPHEYAMHLHLAKVYESMGQTKKSALYAHQARQLARTKRQQMAYEKLNGLFN